MNHRKRFSACILGEPVDRPPFYLFWEPWETTWHRWQREGMPETFRSFDDVRQMFDSDPLVDSLVPVNLGPCPSIPRTVLQEDEESVTFIDRWGIKRRDLKTGMSMSEFLEFPIKNHNDWVRFRDQFLNPDDPRRLEGNWREQCQDWMQKELPIQIGSSPDTGVFGPFRWLLGDEEGLMAFHTMPELVHEIMDHLTTLYLSVFEKVVKEVRVDVIDLWEDMCYRNGPLFSPNTWEAFIGPNYRRIKAFADQHNIPILSVDTDGNPDLIVPEMMRSGVNLLYPMEVAAGCDVNAWQEKYPTLGMLGGVDKRALPLGPAAIDVELDRITPAIRHGRYIPELDHLVPDDVSWENYCYYVTSLRKRIFSG
jgi:hypothetical protein